MTQEEKLKEILSILPPQGSTPLDMTAYAKDILKWHNRQIEPIKSDYYERQHYIKQLLASKYEMLPSQAVFAHKDIDYYYTKQVICEDEGYE